MNDNIYKALATQIENHYIFKPMQNEIKDVLLSIIYINITNRF